MADLERIGRADDVIVLVFSEFGRRVPENTSLGTDHGTAGLMFLIGKPVKGGHYGEVPSLTELTEGDNLRHTTDFRRVYATATAGWLGYPDTRGLLGEDFAPAHVRLRSETSPEPADAPERGRRRRGRRGRAAPQPRATAPLQNRGRLPAWSERYCLQA